jgi:hypothetical protein
MIRLCSKDWTSSAGCFSTLGVSFASSWFELDSFSRCVQFMQMSSYISTFIHSLWHGIVQVEHENSSPDQPSATVDNGRNHIETTNVGSCSTKHVKDVKQSDLR